ncbi:D-alanyl-D-alanine carboxypeptidase family protein [Paenibacillus dakarensis]|uniref:D-alanyl-D-alanine carboxypeptidase family protein n=1 Tax=Paenibacillus dakarensis TaxID=1527293 RepID=UPI0006D587A5
MKKWFVSLAFLLLIGCQSAESMQNRDISAEDSTESQVAEKEPEKTHETVSIPRDQIHKGNLLLVNKDNPVNEAGIPADIVNLYDNNELTEGFALLDNTIQLSTGVVEKFGEMVDAAARQGVTHFMISSGYRNLDEQQRLYKEIGSDYALPVGTVSITLDYRLISVQH